MHEADADEVATAWDRPASTVEDPIEVTLPYLELRLEHPGLDATRFADGFFPDAVPYRDGSTATVFYWRSGLAGDSPPPSDWVGACATTHSLSPIDAGNDVAPALLTERGDGTEVVVDGTVAGDSTTARLAGYRPPRVAVRMVDEVTVRVQVGGSTVLVPTGTRSTVRLPRQTVGTDGEEPEELVVTPLLRVRFPGRRRLVHPQPGSDGALFPPFGLDLDALPNPVPVPTLGGELDHESLADVVGVHLAERPYPERVLWQAFAYSAFDPHQDTTAVIGQSPAGYLVVGGDDRP